MRECKRCNETKELDQFYHRKRGIHSWCKDCCRKDARDFYQKNPDPYKERARTLSKRRGAERSAVAERIKVETGCQLCGENEPCVLDFHHVESRAENGGSPVSRAAHHSDIRFKTELAKCIVVCSNCHRKIHAEKVVVPEDIKRCDLSEWEDIKRCDLSEAGAAKEYDEFLTPFIQNDGTIDLV